MAKKKNGKRKGGFQSQIMSGMLLLLAILFMPTTLILFFGMIPTTVAAVVDRTGRATKAMTVGAMNVAGCTPFLIELWTKGHSTDMALQIISNPLTLIMIWSIAAIGYLIEWAMAGIVSTILVQRSQTRLQDIKKQQAHLVERWGKKVTGTIPLDHRGFPLKEEDKDSEDEPVQE